METREVYFNEYNILMDNAIYLPIVSGLLSSYAKTIPSLAANYRFMPFNFMRDHQDTISRRHLNPSVAAFSVSMWNMNLSLEVARLVKKYFPGCLIVFGGANVPFNADVFLTAYPFIDVVTRGEGEQTFADILLRNLESGDFGGIPGVSYRHPYSGTCIKNDAERSLPQDLDIYPSPYITGEFDHLFLEHPLIRFQAIIETNRGCPYHCSYCLWSQGGLSKKFRFFSMDRIRKIADWCGKRKIGYVFCADSNFGIFKRDLEIAGYFTDVKVKYGLPEKFRVCYAKNAEDTVFEIGRLLHAHDMEKGITLSRQTNCAVAAENVGRQNIKMETYNNLQKKYNAENIPVYTELILGLPGETFESFRDGIEEILQAGIKNQLFVYFCQVYPNTELDDPAYRIKFGLKTVKVPLNEIHAAVRPSTITTEHEDIIVATDSMSAADWGKMAVLAWLMQLLHGLKLGFYIMIYLVGRYSIRYTEILEHLMNCETGGQNVFSSEIAYLHRLAASISKGSARARILPEFGNIYWDIEEGSYLLMASQKNLFYDALAGMVTSFLDKKNIAYDVLELQEVVDYQKALIPQERPPEKTEYHFQFNIPEYFEHYFLETRRPFVKKAQKMKLKNIRDYGVDKKVFATEVMVFGRKSNKMLYHYTWDDE